MSLPPEAYRSVHFDHPHERKQFAFFNTMSHPHFGLVARLDVAPLLTYAQAEQRGVHRMVVHLLSTAANAVSALRRRIRENHVVEHEAVHPSYAVPTDVSSGFSFCEVGFAAEVTTFLHDAKAQEEAMKHTPSFEDVPGRDDYLFMSAIPWVHFTGIQHAMNYHPHDSVPRISWGKVMPEGQQQWMPVSIQAHHALANGSDIGSFYAAAEAYLSELTHR